MDKSLCKQLRSAKSADEIWKIFLHYDQCENEPSASDEEDTPISMPDNAEE